MTKNALTRTDLGILTTASLEASRQRPVSFHQQPEMQPPDIAIMIGFEITTLCTRPQASTYSIHCYKRLPP